MPGRPCRFAVRSAFALALTSAAWLQNAEAQATNRYAVVVGNQDYDAVPDLENARRDATDFSAMLRDHDYVVFDGYDLDREGIENLLRRAVINIPQGSEVVFYFSGHGIQLGRRNYLLPTDAAFESVFDMPVQSVTLDRVVELLSSRGETHVAIIDACRENPFPDVEMAVDLDASLFETKSGFDVMATPINSLVAFSTSPGMLAYDGPTGSNSPYTEAILALSREKKGESFVNVLSGVRERVYSKTDGRQVPWESSTLVRPFSLLPPQSDDVSSETKRPGLRIVQATDDGGDGAGRSSAGSSNPTPTVNSSDVTITAELNRDVALRDLVQSAVDASGFEDLEVLKDPINGRVVVSYEADETWSLFYRPTFSEIPTAGLAEHTLTDTIRVAFRDGSQTYDIDVTLNLQANACDMLAGDALDPQGVGLFVFPNEIKVEEALAACEAATAKHPNEPRFLYQLGRAQQASGALDTAFATFSRAADMGHTRALNAAGYMMFTRNINRDATRIPLDVPAASDLLQRGIAGGDPYAMHTEGQRLLRTGETEAQRQQGFELMERAVELGHTFSMNELGYYFLDRDSSHYVPERGMTYLRASAARGDIYGYNNLGLVALYGLDGSEADFKAAYDWFEKAALGGHPFAPANLGRMIFNGQVPNGTFAQALQWNDMGLARGDGWAGANGAGLILNKGAGGLDAAEAAVRYAKAVHLPAKDAAEQAMSRLGQRTDRELGKALQLVLRELGENISVDGVVGRGTLRSLQNVSDRNGLGSVPTSALDRLLLATKAYWSERPTRPDLF